VKKWVGGPPVELEEFIRNSLLQIMKGVKTAQTEWAADGSGGGVINPSWGGPDDFPNRVQEVKFDIAVTAARKTEGGGGGGIKVLSVDLSGKVAHSAEHNTVSRISFAVPVLPATTTIISPLEPEHRRR
jgi:hypothetical protein